MHFIPEIIPFKNDLGRSWGVTIYTYVHIKIFCVAPSKHDG